MWKDCSVSSFLGAAWRVVAIKVAAKIEKSVFMFLFLILHFNHGSFTNGIARTQMLRNETELL